MRWLVLSIEFIVQMSESCNLGLAYNCYYTHRFLGEELPGKQIGYKNGFTGNLNGARYERQGNSHW